MQPITELQIQGSWKQILNITLKNFKFLKSVDNQFVSTDHHFKADRLSYREPQTSLKRNHQLKFNTRTSSIHVVALLRGK